MSKNSKIIETAFFYVERMCERSDSNARRYFNECYQSVIIEEKRHRRGYPGKPRESVVTAARYFAVKWFFDTAPDLRSWDAAMAWREDARLGWAAQDAFKSTGNDGMVQWLAGRKACLECTTLDYNSAIIKD